MRAAEALAAAALALASVGARAADEPAGKGALEASVVLRWKPVEGAVAYEVEIGADPELRERLVLERVPTPGYRWRAIPAERRWWRARGIDALGRPGRWSEVRALEAVLRPPEPSRPREDAVVAGGGEVEFACAPSPVLAAYELEVASDPELAAVVERRRGEEPRFRLALPDGGYHWRMRATSLSGQTTAWSPVRRLTVRADAPPSTPAAPAAGAPGEALPGAGEVADAAATTAAPAAPEAPDPLLALEVALPPFAEIPPLHASPAPPPPAPSHRPLRVGLRLGWHTTFAGISSASPGVEVDWLPPRLAGRLALSLRAAYYGASSTVPAQPGLPAPVPASVHVVPVGVAAVYEHPLASFGLYGGAGAQAQLVHAAVAGEERLDAVPGALFLAGLSRRVRAGELFAESGWATGSLDGRIARLRTGGLYLSAGWRYRP